VRKNHLLETVKNTIQQIDWKLLLFLVLFLNVKLVIKLIAILIIYCIRFNLKFGFRFRSSRLPLFYPFVIGIALLNWVLNGSFVHLNQSAALLAGLSMWLLCILAIHQLQLSIENNSLEKIHNTILVFFILNSIFSFLNYFLIVLDSGSFNPFLYQGQYQKYFMGTGDHIRGLTFDTSTTNALMNALGIVYFFHRRQIIMTFICMIILLFTASNLTNFLIAGILVYLFIFQSNRVQKSVFIICLSFLLIFIAKISPQNNQYTLELIQKTFKKDKEILSATSKVSTEKPDSLLTAEEKKQKIALLYLDSIGHVLSEQRKLSRHPGPFILPKIQSFEPNIHTLPFQRIRDTTNIQEKLMEVAKKIKADSIVNQIADSKYQLPGKVIAFKQTIQFFKKHPQKIVTGAGMGNFSSKLAFRTTALNISGGYPSRLAYVNDYFRDNHFVDYVYYFSRDAQYHSIVNSPNSVYNQLAGEYGFLGILAFIFFYLGFFVKRMNGNSMVIPLLLIITGAFFIDYWFEQLSIVVLFELLALLNNKEIELNKKNQNIG
jgi:hypothetical protein